MVATPLPEFNPHLRTPRPSLLAGVLFFLLTGCGSFSLPWTKEEKNSLAGNAYREMGPQDYRAHLASLKQPFLATPGVKAGRMSENGRAYLQAIGKEIIDNNEIFFKDLRTAQITLLQTESPLHFSLPGGEIFLSTGLLQKYIKHESMLVSVLAYELVKSEKLLYPKDIVIPVGYLPLERMIMLNRLALEEKMEVLKWAYHLTIRSGYDGEYFLSWLQTQNRNTADFILQVGDANQIAREEALFKAFLIKNPMAENVHIKKNSSKNFYGLINSIRDGV
jgi:hypothetical protein